MQLGKILISAAIAVAPLLAQKKAVVAKKAPTKEPVATPAPEPKAAESARLAEAPAKPAANSGSELKFSALVWGGYNVPSSDYFQQATSGLTKGGVAGGVEFLAGTGFIRGGVAASYIPVYVFESGNSKDTKTLLPLEGVLNLYLFGFYAGGRGGYVVDIGSTTSTSTAYQKTNGTTFGGQVGYQYSLGPVAIDIGVIATFAHTEAHGSGGAAGAHADYTNITPRIGIQYTF
jgi:hypothetical protein